MTRDRFYRFESSAQNPSAGRHTTNDKKGPAMQMTDFGSAADLYPPSAANNWYSSQFSSMANSFGGLNGNLTNLAGSPGHHHQLNTLNQLHHSAASLDSATNAVLHNSPPNSTSPQQTGAHQPTGASQLTNLSNSGLPSLTATQTTQSNHSTQQLLSPTQTQQSRSNALSLNLSTSSNSTSTNSSNNALPAYSSQLAAVNGSAGSSAANSVTAHLHHQAHPFNIPSHLGAVHSAVAAQHSTHSQFSPQSLAGHHSHHQHPLNHLTAHQHFLNVANVPNNFFPVHHANTATSLTGPSAFTAPPSPSSPNNTSINSTTTAFNGLTFHRPDSASNTPGSAMNAVAAITAMSRASGLSPTDNVNHHQLNGGSGYERMHTGYSAYPSLIEHHHSSRASGFEFMNLRHMPTLTNLTSNCNPGANSLNNLDDSNVNSMFIAHHHNQSLNPASLMACHNQNHAGTPGPQLVPLHASTHNSSVNSSSDSREDEMGLNCLASIKQEEEDDKLAVQFAASAPLEVHHHPMSYNWVKKTSHSSQAQAGNKR